MCLEAAIRPGSCSRGWRSTFVQYLHSRARGMLNRRGLTIRRGEMK
jgi:hypothetical protein